MNPLLVVIPYHNGDASTVKNLLDWIAELGKVDSHSVLLAADSTTERTTMLDLMTQARSVFNSADTILIDVPANKQVWGHATKIMFENVCNQINECYKLPWFWMEPDCVPLKAGWVDKLAEAYERCARQYMGAIVTPEQLKAGPPHMAGPGIYPANAYEKLKPFLAAGEHFDLAIAPYVLPRARNTQLIHHFWGKKDLAPVFKESPDGLENTMLVSQIRQEAAIFHRNKDGSLINLLRNKPSMFQKVFDKTQQALRPKQSPRELVPTL